MAPWIDRFQAVAGLGAEEIKEDSRGRNADFFSIRADDGESLLHHTVRQNEPDKVEALAKHMNINTRDLEGNTPLHEAAEIGLVDMIKKLTELGADPNARNKHAQTPLHLAAVRSSDATEAMLDGGADPNTRNNDYKTAWDLIQDRDVFKDTNAFWRLNDARFDAEEEDAR